LPTIDIANDRLDWSMGTLDYGRTLVWIIELLAHVKFWVCKLKIIIFNSIGHQNRFHSNLWRISIETHDGGFVRGQNVGAALRFFNNFTNLLIFKMIIWCYEQKIIDKIGFNFYPGSFLNFVRKSRVSNSFLPKYTRPK